MSKNNQIEIALDLLDFSEGLLLQKVVEAFWNARSYNISDDDKKKVFLTAYTLQMK